MSRRPKPSVTRLPPPTVRRPTPKPPASLGAEGIAAWKYLWKLHWIVPERHRRTVERYCRMQDLLAAAHAQVDRDGLMTEGSHGQLRAHPAMAEIRMLTTESRLTEVELGLTPASESKAGVPAVLPRGVLDDVMDRRRRPLGAVDDDGDEDDPRFGLKVVP